MSEPGVGSGLEPGDFRHSGCVLRWGEGEHAPFPFGLLPEGEHEAPKPPAGHWICMACTMFNPLSLFYCDVCNTARPDLGSVRF